MMATHSLTMNSIDTAMLLARQDAASNFAETDQKQLLRQLLDALVPWILGNLNSTFSPVGNNTLTIGDQLRWKKAETIARKLVEWSIPMEQPMPSSTKSISQEHLLDSLGAFNIFYAPRNQSVLMLASAYSLCNDDVANFVYKRHALVRFLNEAQSELARHFGEDVRVELRLFYDSAGEPDLVGWIQCDGRNLDNALDRLFTFEDAWFLDHMNDIDERFNFNIEAR